jgi:Ca2+-binding RTX toxin-like protein
MDGGTGDDIVVASPDVQSGSMTGGPDDDVLAVNGAAAYGGRGVTLTGDDGNDTIIGGPFGDTVDGGPGRDVIDVAGAPTDRMFRVARQRRATGAVTTASARPGGQEAGEEARGRPESCRRARGSDESGDERLWSSVGSSGLLAAELN